MIFTDTKDVATKVLDVTRPVNITEAPWITLSSTGRSYTHPTWGTKEIMILNACATVPKKGEAFSTVSIELSSPIHFLSYEACIIYQDMSNPFTKLVEVEPAWKVAPKGIGFNVLCSWFETPELATPKIDLNTQNNGTDTKYDNAYGSYNIYYIERPAYAVV